MTETILTVQHCMMLDLPYTLPSIFRSHYLYIKNNPVIAIISNIMYLNVCVYIDICLEVTREFIGMLDYLKEWYE